MKHPQNPAKYPLNSLIEGIPEEAYNAHPGLRSTELKHAAKSAGHWKAYLDAPPKESAAFATGRLVHLAILEPQRFATQVVVAPAQSQTPAKFKAWAATLEAPNIAVTEADYRIAEAIGAAVAAHPVMSGMLKGGHREASLFWHDEEFNLPQKARFDFVSSDGLVVDIKTTRDASEREFARDCVNNGYAISAAHYLEGARVSEVANPHNFCIVACEKTPPYGVIVYDLSPQAIERGTNWRKHALSNIRRARQTNIFDAYPQQVIALEEPAWAPQCIEHAGKNA